jgi:hypothetical protein
VVYVYDGSQGEEPSGASLETVSYDLRPMEELWDRRHNDAGATYCTSFDFVGSRGCVLEGLASSFGGSCSPFGDQCAANPPWGWSSDAGGAPTGEWFLDPAYAAGFLHLESLPERNDPGFLDYVSNLYLQGNAFVRVDGPVAGFQWSVGGVGFVSWISNDAGQGPVLNSHVTVELSRAGGAWETIAASVPRGAGSVSWTVTSPPSAACRVRVRCGTDCVLEISDESDSFVIVSGVSGVDDLPVPQPLLTVRPNPFRSQARVEFDLPEGARVGLHVFDASGRLVRALIEPGAFEPGPHGVSWNATDAQGRRVPPGAYFLRLSVDEQVVTEKILSVY